MTKILNMFRTGFLKLYRPIILLLDLCFGVFLIVLSIMVSMACFDHIAIEGEVKAFKAKGVFVSEEMYRGSTIRFYEVESSHTLSSPTINRVGNSVYLGSPGDIFLMPASYFKTFPLSDSFISFFFGGHAGMIGEHGEIVQTTGANPLPEDNIISVFDNDLLARRDGRNVYGVRVKVKDASDTQKALEHAYSKEGSLYNYWFIFDRTEKYYCTDIVTRSFGKEAGLNYNLDQDGVASTIADIFLSPVTELIFYKEIIKDNLFNVYYLVPKK